MSFQTIFEISQSISVQNRRTVGQQVSRSGQVRVAEYLTSVPWSFTVRPHAYLYYPQVRGVIQAIDNKDRQLPETITFASSLLSWFDDYKGGLTSGQAAALTLAAVPAANHNHCWQPAQRISRYSGVCCWRFSSAWGLPV